MKNNFKSSIAAVLCGIMCLSLCACGNNSEADSSETVTSSAAGNGVQDSKTESSDSDEDADKTSADNADSEDTEENVPEDGHYLNIDSPAPFGEWVTSAHFNAVSGKEEVIYWRIVNVREDAQDTVDEYNKNSKFTTIVTSSDEDFIKFYELEYEIKYPEEYTAAEWGISSVNLSMWAENPDGAGFDKDGVSYIGLGQCLDVTNGVREKSDTKPQPGDTETKIAVFTMLEGSPNFVFSYEYTDVDGERKTSFAASR